MIPGAETDRVYLSERLKIDYPDFCRRLCAILDRHDVPYIFLQKTDQENDLWCRDYMPIQVAENKFMRFRYEPSYLKNYQITRTDPGVICKANEIEYDYSNINLDGGNVVSYQDKVIISDRVYSENPECTDRGALISGIKELLNAEEVITIESFPKKYDMTGHADGMVRFVDENTVVGNEQEDGVEIRNSELLKDKGIKYIEIPFFEHIDSKHKISAVGLYVNYLEVMDLIVLPKYEMERNRDNEALAIFREIFPDRNIEQLDCRRIAEKGGVLNCITWTVKGS
jgi:agmatine deiminase